MPATVDRDRCYQAAQAILNAFPLDAAREGGGYWLKIVYRLLDLANGEPLDRRAA